MRPIRAFISWFYALGVNIRHRLFDWHILRSERFDIPIVCVGNLSVGGTGKTPVVEFLIRRLSNRFHVAVLSRGYGRKTKGYLEVEADMSFRRSGDEPKQIKRKFPDIPVVVCENRCKGIRELRERHPEVDLILMDDGFQHRYVSPKLNILLVDYNRPIWKDHMLPLGSLRDSLSQLPRAHYVIATKCPPRMNPLDRRIVRKWLDLRPYQSLYFTSMQNDRPVPLFPDEAPELTGGSDVIVMAGIADPTPLIETVSQRYHLVDRLIFRDHHPYRIRDLQKMQNALDAAPEGTVILTTEKDAVKLTNAHRVPAELRRKLYFQPVRLVFHEQQEEFIQKLIHDVLSDETN